MKHRTVRLTCFTIVLGLIAPPLVAERNLIPSLESVLDVSSERPSEPDWMKNIALQDAYQRVSVVFEPSPKIMYRKCPENAPAWQGIFDSICSNNDLVQDIYRAQSMERIVQTCCMPRTATTAVQMIFDLKPKRSAKSQAIGRDILK